MAYKTLLSLFKKQNIVKRALSALVLAPLALCIIYWGGIIFAASVLLIFALVWIEAYKIIFQAQNITSKQRLVWKVIAVIYSVLPVLSVLYLRAIPGIGQSIIFWLCAVVWATDIGGYIFGIIIGGPKILPAISPSKTWSGFMGGIILSFVTYCIIKDFLVLNDLIGAYFVIIISIISQIGDFLQSAFKRYFKVKDSGNLIPGHGGLMDRLDGFILASIFVAIYFVGNM